MMKPIIFSGEMVNAILDGRKTQTRRVLTPQPKWDAEREQWMVRNRYAYTFPVAEARPFNVGDLLWVREAWRSLDGLDGMNATQIAHQCVEEAGYHRPWVPVQYEADGQRDNWLRSPDGFGTLPGRYRHARFMPRWVSRITLRVTDVRVQRLQEISDADAAAEGGEQDEETDGWWGAAGDGVAGATRCYTTARLAFSDRWNLINAKRGYGWDVSPWVVAITFRPVLANIDGMGW